MMLSFTMMGAAIVGLALIPGYKTIGIAAPILAVLARMLQGFSLGGEVGPTTAYLMEAAPVNKRGLAVSWQGASQYIAATTGGLVGVGLSAALSPAASDHHVTENEKPPRTPIRSISQPMGNSPLIIPN